MADVEAVFKIAAYKEDDFLIYFKRKSTKEVLYYLTHTKMELGTELGTDKLSDFAFNDEQIEHSDIVAMKNKFTFTRINFNLEEKRSAIGELGNFELR